MLLTIKQYAEKRGISIRTIYSRKRAGTQPGLQVIKNKWYIDDEIADAEKKKAVVYLISETRDFLYKNDMVKYCQTQNYFIERIVSEYGSNKDGTRRKLNKLMLEKDYDVLVVYQLSDISEFNAEMIVSMKKEMGQIIDAARVDEVAAPIIKKEKPVEEESAQDIIEKMRMGLGIDRKPAFKKEDKVIEKDADLTEEEKSMPLDEYFAYLRKKEEGEVMAKRAANKNFSINVSAEDIANVKEKDEPPEE